MAASPNTTANFLDRVAARLGYQKARQGGAPFIRAVAEHGSWNLPDYALHKNQFNSRPTRSFRQSTPPCA